MDLNSQVQKEGLCIIRLCKDLSDFIRFGRFRKTFLYETGEFVDFIVDVLEAVDSSVRNDIVKSIDPPLIKSKLREFEQIRKALSWLYVFTKEAIDADTLSIPYSLTIFLNYIVNKIKDPTKVFLVVLGSSNLMYYKYNLRDLRDLTCYLNNEISTCPQLRESIGILKFPYCAAGDILTNCILFHEMGHYVYENSGLFNQINSQIESSFESFFQDNNKSNSLVKSTLTPLYGKRLLLNYSKKLLLNWADEIFADIFAIRISGPSFHLAFLELEQVLHTDIDRNKKFSATHPADYYRFKMHERWLLNEDWEDIIKDRLPLVHKKLNECNKLKIENFSIYCRSPLQDRGLEQVFHDWILVEFEKIVAHIESEISDLMKNYPRPIDDFRMCDDLVTSYLNHGVVPSTVYNDQKEDCCPHPTTILNSGFFFYLEGMNELLSKIKNSESDIDNKVHFGKRLNEWLAKAIEDWQIIQEREKL